MLDLKSLHGGISHHTKKEFNIDNPTVLELASNSFEKESLNISRKDYEKSVLEASKETSSKLQDAIIYNKEDE